MVQEYLRDGGVMRLLPAVIEEEGVPDGRGINWSGFGRMPYDFRLEDAS